MMKLKSMRDHNFLKRETLNKLRKIEKRTIRGFYSLKFWSLKLKQLLVSMIQTWKSYNKHLKTVRYKSSFLNP